MSVKIKYNKQLITLLSSIFYTSKDDEEDFLPVIKESKNIPKVIELLSKCLSDNQIDVNNSISAVYFLTSLFGQNSQLVPVFIEKCIISRRNIYECLIFLFLNEKISGADQKLIEDFFLTVTTYAAIPKNAIEYAYERLSLYFTEQSKIKLTNDLFLRYLKLLNLFYTDKNNVPSENGQKEKKENKEQKNNKENTENSNEQNEEKEDDSNDIFNYIYFSGLKSSMTISINKNSNNPNADFPNLENGLSIAFWVKFEEELLKTYYGLLPQNTEVDLIKIKVGQHYIRLKLQDRRSLGLCIDNMPSNVIDISQIIKFREWSSIIFTIEPKPHKKKGSIKILINNIGTVSSSLNFPKDFNSNDKIESIILFENFIGKATSVLFCGFLIDQKLSQFLSTAVGSGFSKAKILLEFLHSVDKDFYSNVINYNYFKQQQQTKNDKSLGKSYNITILNREQNLNNIMCCFCPFNYNKHTKILDDVFGNFIAKLHDDDGANYYSNTVKNISQIGGMNNILPIAELMLISMKRVNKMIDEKILNENTFIEYLKIIQKILYKHEENVNQANKSLFFPSLGLFLEKFPSQIFTINVLKLLAEIGKESFIYGDSNEDTQNYTDTTFIGNIFFNEKIISKFSIDNQVKLWEIVQEFFKNNYEQIKNSINIGKFCSLLRYFDEDRYEKYCCSTHANLFNCKNTERIVIPDMNTRLKILFEILQLYIDKYDAEKENVSLYKLLSLDLSPCLQKKIVQVYITHFSNNEIDDKIKLKTFNSLLQNNYCELTEYALSISLLDVRTEILKLLQIFLVKFRIQMQEYMNRNSYNISQFFIFISINVLPTNLKIKEIKEGEENNVKNYMHSYFNLKIYNEDINNFYNSLLSWMTHHPPLLKLMMSKQNPNQKHVKTNSMDVIPTKNPARKRKSSAEIQLQEIKDKNMIINSYVINFIIIFLKKSDQVFIDKFLKSLIVVLDDDNVSNKDVLFSNKIFFPWLIESIFYFYGSEKKTTIKDETIITSIKTQLLQTLRSVFLVKVNIDDVEDKLNYFIEYSYYLKNKFSKNKKKFQEIITITRLILENILKSSQQKYFEVKVKYIFEFMFFYNSEDKIKIRKNPQIRHNTVSNIFSENSLKQIIPKVRKSKIDFDMWDLIELNSMNLQEDSGNKQNENDINSDNFSKTNSANFTSLLKLPPVNEGELIPKYMFDGINYNEEKKNENRLKDKWDDYGLYKIIMKHYLINSWSIENLCKKAKISYKSNKLLDVGPELIKIYGDCNNDFKNVLFKEICRCVIINDEKEQKIKLMDILNIIVILICSAHEISTDQTEKKDLIINLIEFLIFCILCSINIQNTETYYSLIQKLIYDTLEYGLKFLEKNCNDAYKKLLKSYIESYKDEYINPNNQSGGHLKLKKLFGGKKEKKKVDKGTAVYKLFFYPTDPENPENNKNLKKTDTTGSTTPGSVEKGINKQSMLFLNMDKSSIFEKIITFFMVEKSQYETSTFYQFLSNDIDEIDINKDDEIKFDNEKNKLHNFIKTLIPVFETEIKKFSNISYIEEKRRRNNYKKSKKELFSWNGFWSDKNLFFEHPEYLKLKLKNHFTKEMTKIILTPILDFTYYLPKFSKFNTSTLFNKEDYKYNICLDIDKILDISQKKPNDEKCNINDIINFKKNIYGFNHLECIYKYQYTGLWDKYKLYYEENSDDLDSGKIFDLLFKDKLIEMKEENIKFENFYMCCMVKPTHHVKGYVSTEKDSIIFSYCPDNEAMNLENDISYDKDMGACFGSTFKNHHKDKNVILFTIKYANIEFLLKRQYFYQETGAEIYTLEHKSYFFNFKTSEECNKFFDDILHHEKLRPIKCHDLKHKKINNLKSKKLLGYGRLFGIYTKKKSYHVSNKSEEWQNRIISTLEYLMWLNIFSGRSYNDLTQYPVFPWIITNYENENLNINDDIRNMSLPVGMFDMNEKAEMRKETFIEFYETLKTDLKESNKDFNYKDFLEKGAEYLEKYKIKRIKKKLKEEKKNKEVSEEDSSSIDINQIPFYYGSHYSNPTYVSHFLTRLFPFASISIEIHGDKFDDPNRMFFSMFRTFETASTLKDDVRELIPEFYIMPEMFKNINNLNLAQDKMDSEGNKIIINDVLLPPWSQNKDINFVVELRKNLEKSQKLNKWIDLIFGYLQIGEKAEEVHNIFMLNTYEYMVKITDIKDEDERNALMRLYEVGVTPKQVFSSESKVKNEINQIIKNNPVYNLCKGSFLWESTELKCFNIESYKYKKLMVKLINNKKPSKDSEEIQHKIIKINCVNQNELRIISNTGFWFNLKFERKENKYNIEESSLKEFPNISSKYACSSQMTGIQIPIIIYGGSKFMLRAGFWDGRIEINLISNDEKESLNYNYCYFVKEGAVITMQMTKDEKYLLCGTKLGYILFFSVNNLKLTLLKKLFYHSDEITSISINDNLNLFATASMDGYIMLYLLPTCELIRSIKIKDNSELNEAIYANNVFLSSSPLPCLVFYISSKKIFKSYTINGEFISEIQETDNSCLIKSPIIFSDLNFLDYLIYGTDDGFIKMRKFPDMSLFNSFKQSDNEIVTLELSPDKRYCYAWSKGDIITVVKDVSVYDPDCENKKLKSKFRI